MHLRIAFQEFVGGALCRVNIPGADHADDGIGRFCQQIVGVVMLWEGKPSDTTRSGLWRWWCGGPGRRFVFGKAAVLVFLATTAGTGIISSDFGHFDNVSWRMIHLYQEVLADARYHELLLSFDRDLAAAARAEGCACGGVRHSARYSRKPRGKPADLPEEYDRRFSYCCAVHGCRSRCTPPSLRFLGRKVYLATIVVLITAMVHGTTENRLAHLTEVLGISRRTVARWREWWRSSLTTTRFWKAASAAFMPPIDALTLPASLLERFPGDTRDALVALLRFLGPITGGASMHAF